MSPPVNTPLHPADEWLLRASLMAVWWWTVAVSLLEYDGQSLALLQAGGIESASLAHVLTLGGVALDAALALALMAWPRRATYAVAAVATLALTATATALLPGLWLHPVGPLVKNLPVLAVLAVLYRRALS